MRPKEGIQAAGYPAESGFSLLPHPEAVQNLLSFSQLDYSAIKYEY